MIRIAHVSRLLALATLVSVLGVSVLGGQSAFAQPNVLDSLLRQVPIRSRTIDTSFVNLLNDIAYQYWQSNLDSSSRYATQARQYAQQQGYQRGIASAWENFGRIAITQGKYDSASAFHNEAFRIYTKIGSKAGCASTLTGLGLICRLRGKYTESLAHYKQALEFLRTDSLSVPTVNSSEQKTRARILNNIAMVYRLQGRYGEALPYLLQALELWKRSNNRAGVAGLQRNIGLLYDAQHRYDQAQQWYSESLAGYTAIVDKQGVASVQDNIGMVHYQVGKLDSADRAHQIAVALYTEIGNVQGMASALYNRANVFMAKGMTDSAENFHRRALVLREKLGDKEAIASSLVGMAQTHVVLQRYQEALVFFERAAGYADSIGALSVAEQAYAGLGQVYERRGTPIQALAAYKRLLLLRDTLFTEKSVRALSELQAQHNSEQQEQRIRLLESEQHLQVLELERQAMLRNYALGLGLMAFLIAGLALYGYRAKRRSAEMLHQQNCEILEQQSLLERQSADIEIANATLNEKNMALEHQQAILEEQSREIEIANTALQEKNVELEHLSNEKNEFMGIAAHDLKNPLTHIIMASDTTLRYYDRLSDDDVREQLHRMASVARQMTEIISNFLDVNAIERGGLSLQMTVLDLGSLTRSIVQNYVHRAAAKNIMLNTEISSQALVDADEQAARQVLDNIISNAIKYSPRGKQVFVRVISHLSLGSGHSSDESDNRMSNVLMTNNQSANDYVRVEVQDEGEGISPDDMKKLFGKFARLSARPTGGEHSTGLGLSIVKKMVEAMNGRVWCESELGKGATFIVELPRIAP